MNGRLTTSYKVYQQSAKRSIQMNSLFCTQTRSQLKYIAIGSNAKWPLSTTFRSQNSKVASAKKDAVSTLPAWAKRLVLNVTPTPFKPILLAQTAYFPPENRTFTLRAATADSEITQKRTATNALLKSTMRRRPVNLRKTAAAAVVAEGEEVAEVDVAAEVDVEVETTPKELIWLMLTPSMHLPTLQYSADSHSVSKQQ